jgi:hypothetical protein
MDKLVRVGKATGRLMAALRLGRLILGRQRLKKRLARDAEPSKLGIVGRIFPIWRGEPFTARGEEPGLPGEML